MKGFNGNLKWGLMLPSLGTFNLTIRHLVVVVVLVIVIAIESTQMLVIIMCQALW